MSARFSGSSSCGRESNAFVHADEESRLRAAQQLASAALACEPVDLGVIPWPTAPAGTALAPARSAGRLVSPAARTPGSAYHDPDGQRLRLVCSLTLPMACARGFSEHAPGTP